MSIDRRTTDGVERGRRITIHFDGEPIVAYEGETLAAALWAADRVVVRRSSRTGAPRALFCNMGICYECLVRIDGVQVRACTTLVADGQQVHTGGKS